MPWTPSRWRSGQRLSARYIGFDAGQPCTVGNLCRYLDTPDTARDYLGRHKTPESREEKKSSSQQRKQRSVVCPTKTRQQSRCQWEMQTESRSERAGETKEGMTSNLMWKWQARSATAAILLVRARFLQWNLLEFSRRSSPSPCFLLPATSSQPGTPSSRPAQPRLSRFGWFVGRRWFQVYLDTQSPARSTGCFRVI